MPATLADQATASRARAGLQKTPELRAAFRCIEAEWSCHSVAIPRKAHRALTCPRQHTGAAGTTHSHPGAQPMSWPASIDLQTLSTLEKGLGQKPGLSASSGHEGLPLLACGQAHSGAGHAQLATLHLHVDQQGVDVGRADTPQACCLPHVSRLSLHTRPFSVARQVQSVA